MSKNIIVQDFNVQVKGRGLFAVKTTGGECFVPTFGYNEKGQVKARKIAEKEGYAPLEQEWIDAQVVLSADDFRKTIHREAHNDGQNHTFDQEYHRDAISEDVLVYVAVIRKSDAPNEVGILVDSSPMSLENSSITVEKDEYKYDR